MSGSLDDRVREAEQLLDGPPDLSAHVYYEALQDLLPALVRDRERLQRIEEAARHWAIRRTNDVAGQDEANRRLLAAVSSGGEETRE